MIHLVCIFNLVLFFKLSQSKALSSSQHLIFCVWWSVVLIDWEQQLLLAQSGKYIHSSTLLQVQLQGSCTWVFPFCFNSLHLRGNNAFFTSLIILPDSFSYQLLFRLHFLNTSFLSSENFISPHVLIFNRAVLGSHRAAKNRVKISVC